MRHLFPAGSRQASVVCNWYLSPRWRCLLHRGIEGAGRRQKAVIDLENETEHLKFGFAGKPAVFADTVQRPFVAASFASFTYSDVIIPSSCRVSTRATRSEETHFGTVNSFFNRVFKKKKKDNPRPRVHPGLWMFSEMNRQSGKTVMQCNKTSPTRGKKNSLLLRGFYFKGV